jgi:hypothetical protein
MCKRKGAVARKAVARERRMQEGRKEGEKEGKGREKKGKREKWNRRKEGNEEGRKELKKGRQKFTMTSDGTIDEGNVTSDGTIDEGNVTSDGTIDKENVAERHLPLTNNSWWYKFDRWTMAGKHSPSQKTGDGTNLTGEQWQGSAYLHKRQVMVQIWQVNNGREALTFTNDRWWYRFDRWTMAGKRLPSRHWPPASDGWQWLHLRMHPEISNLSHFQ